jgi:catechol 2,3-dioxygenase-like lactoylglutathione lyase family enzyme
VYETVLYARDVPAAVAFYGDVLGLALIDEPDELGAFFRLDSGAMLLIFDPRRSSVPGRVAPSHGSEGAGHIAFQVDRSKLDWWRAHFRELGIEIEKDKAYEGGAQHLYVRDPAGNSVELVEGELWP